MLDTMLIAVAMIPAEAADAPVAVADSAEIESIKERGALLQV